MSSTTTSSMTSSASASATSAAAGLHANSNLKVVGVILAIVSGLLIGSSFVFKKKGLISSQKVQGDGVAYLKSVSPAVAKTLMRSSFGRDCASAAMVDRHDHDDFGRVMQFCSVCIRRSTYCHTAWSFVCRCLCYPVVMVPERKVVVLRLARMRIVHRTLSRANSSHDVNFMQLGSVIIALNTPGESATGQIREFQKLFLAPGFLAYISVLITISLVIMFYFGPKYGTQSMLWFIAVCSLIGGISVSVTTGLGASIVTTAQGDNQFKHWFMYFLLVFIVVTLVTEVFYLNKALALYNTAMVTPTYYVSFTFCSIVTTIVLFQGLKASVPQIITIIMGFLTICIGITILQMSKIDPKELDAKLDRRSTMLLQAARSQTFTEGDDQEKSIAGIEDPGIDTLRGGFGAVGSIIRANTARRLSMSSRASLRSRASARPVPGTENVQGIVLHPGMQRHQLYDAPVPGASVPDRSNSLLADPNATPQRQPTIKFGSQDVVHSYHPTGQGDEARHEQRLAQGYPPDGDNTISPNARLHYSPDSRPQGPPMLHSKFFVPPDAVLEVSPEIPSVPYHGPESKLPRDLPKFNKPYPRTPDDTEEVERLFQHRSSTQSLDSLNSPPSLEDLDDVIPPGGIRLVAPSGGNRF